MGVKCLHWGILLKETVTKRQPSLIRTELDGVGTYRQKLEAEKALQIGLYEKVTKDGQALHG